MRTDPTEETLTNAPERDTYRARAESPSSPSQPDAVIEKAQNGDELALEELLGWYRPMILAQATSLKGLAPWRDLVSAGRSGLWSALRGYDASRGSFAPYARPFVRGEMLKLVRGDRPEVFEAGPSCEPESADVGERVERLVIGLDDRGAEDRAALLEKLERLRQALAALPSEKQRRVVAAHLAGATVAEIMAEHGIKSRQAAHQLLQRGLQALTPELTDLFEEENE